MENAAGRVAAEKIGERSGRGGLRAEHGDGGGVDAIHGTIGVERKDTGRNIFEDGFHQLAAALDFLNGLLKAIGEVVDLLARAAELAGHLVEGVDEDAELVVGARGDAVIEIAAGDLLGGFGKGLDGYGDALGKKERDPHGGEEQEQGDEREADKNLALKDAQVLILRGVGEVLVLDALEAIEEVVWDASADHERARLIRSAAGNVEFAANLPDLGAAGERKGAVECRVRRIGGDADCLRAVVICDPDDIEFRVRADGIVAQVVFFMRSGEPVGDAPGESVQAIVLCSAHFGDEAATLFAGDFERLGEPDIHGAIDKRIAEEEQENDGKKGNAHGAKDHFGFYARTKDPSTVLGPEANQVADEDESKDEKSDEAESGERKQNDEVVAASRMNRGV